MDEEEHLGNLEHRDELGSESEMRVIAIASGKSW